MAGSIHGAGNSGNQADEIRYRSYLTQLEHQQDAEIKDKESQHKDKLTKVIQNHSDQENQLQKDYEVKISDEAEFREGRLSEIRERNFAMIEHERQNGQNEAEKIKLQFQQRIEQEKKAGDEQLTKLQQYYKKAADELAKQFESKKNQPTQKGTPA